MRHSPLIILCVALAACSSTTVVSEDEQLKCHPGYEMVDGVCRVIEIFVPGGAFVMGRGYCFPEDEHEEEFESGACAVSDEPHEVTLGDLWVDAVEVPGIEVLVPEVEAELDETCPSRAVECTLPGYWGPVRPDVVTAFDGIEDPCELVGKRLPTEAEWEYVASAAGTRTYPWGEEPPSCELAQFGNQCGDDIGPVGKHQQSPEGFYDLAGNASELVRKNPSYTGGYPPPPLYDVDAEGPSLEMREALLLRGGSKRSGAHLLRAAHRSTGLIRDQVPVGFRCVRDP